MQRFFALGGKPCSAEGRAAFHQVPLRVQASDQRWSVALRADGLMVWTVDSDVRSLRCYKLDDRGIVLGTLFRRSARAEQAKPLLQLDARDARTVCRTRGRALVDEFWGRYVALLLEGDSLCVLRDPAGAQKCYYARYHGMLAVFSHLADLLELLPLTLSVNENHIAACLKLHFFPSSGETGFNEIREVHGGQSLTLTGPTLRDDFHWDALKICRTEAVEDIDQASYLLKEAVLQSVQAWASCYQRVLHELSGGLDSSIVLACLAKSAATTQVVCSTYYTTDAQGDERKFARLMAARAGVQLEERPVGNQVRTRIDEFVDACGVTTPLLAKFTCEDDRRRPPLVSKHGSEAILSGQGGDQVFWRGLHVLDAVDWARTHGVGARLPRIVADAAQAANQPFWPTLRAAIVHGLARVPASLFMTVPVPDFIRLPDVQPEARIHPWLVEHDLPPGKAAQLMNIIEAQSLWARECPYADEIHPLISQPVIEACLRIPTYVLAHGGVERALVRKAFSADLPQEIVRRYSKGAVDRHFFAVVNDNRELIRAFLSDGLLAERGVIDKKLMREALARPLVVTRGADLLPFATACKCEMWLRETQSRARNMRTDRTALDDASLVTC
jgi:asparagine synthase (glutamine-hydrolysing)